MPVRTGIVIVGAGFGGIGMGIALKKAGYHDFVILEKDDDLGGTWRDNSYPGCACDVPSPLYSYSYELNPAWTRLFAPQREIWDYLRMCARKYGVDTHIRYGCAVDRMDWDEGAGCWHIATGSGGYRARAVVSAGGALHLPSYPDIPRPHCFQRYRLSLRALGSPRRPDGPAGRGDRHGGLRDPVHPRDRRPAGPAAGVPALGAVAPPAAGHHHPGPGARHAGGRAAGGPGGAGRHLLGAGSQGARLRRPSPADGPAGGAGSAASEPPGRRPGPARQADPGLHHRMQAHPAVLQLLSRPATAQRGPHHRPDHRDNAELAWSPRTARSTRPT